MSKLLQNTLFAALAAWAIHGFHAPWNDSQTSAGTSVAALSLQR